MCNLIARLDRRKRHFLGVRLAGKTGPNERYVLDRTITITADKGFWLVETWDRSSLAARILGKHWH